ncbi:GNAT family N-acetyltransferase [Aneurinibacillus sp. REN35]|uniref:GNAT family N-acetyltransferase n=1 Tax=Aneurinibacillus sp. REN35 TaxID=3237286 RepID=UPI003527427A
MVTEFFSEDEWRIAYPVMRDLRTELQEDEFITIMRQMKEEGYRLFALYEQDEIVTLAGIAVLHNMYYGKHIWVHELVTKADKRSKGYGEKMLHFLASWGEEQGCDTIALASAFFREDAHRFYEEKMGFEKSNFTFVKQLHVSPAPLS